MAKAKRKTATSRPRSAPGSVKKKGKRRTSYKNKSIAPIVQTGAVLIGTAVSPLGAKAIASVRGRSVKPMASWSRDEIVRTGILIGGSAVGGKLIGNVINGVKPIRHVVNRGLKMLKGVI